MKPLALSSGTASATGTIIDNDNAPVIAPASATEGCVAILR
jgi:hypothetical protein